jgi:large subunit ribosomal protein L15e
MGAYKYIRKNERLTLKNKAARRAILNTLEKSSIVSRVDRPTRLTRAKEIGYHAKQGYLIVRVKVAKGSFRRPRPVHARKPSKTGLYFNLAASKKDIAENRALRVYRNAKVLGSYFLAENGQYKWFEIIMKANNAVN